MNLYKTLKELYHKDFKLIHTDLGLSNDIYIIEFNGIKKHVARVINKDADTMANHELERQIQVALRGQNIDFDENAYIDKEKIRIVDYVDNIKTFKECEDPNKYFITIDLIKKFHEIDINTNHNFDLKKRYELYKKQVINPLFDYKEFEYLIDDFDTLDDKYILSHNDLVDGNILFTNDRSYLIDYEFAAKNHPYFDLMSFLSENNIYNQELRLKIYNYYFDNKLDEKTLKKMTIIEKAQDLLWATWANMLYDLRGKEIYKQIFIDKTDRLKGY